MKFKVVELIPYSTFKERLRIVKEHIGTGYVEVFDDFIYIERWENEKDNS